MSTRRWIGEVLASSLLVMFIGGALAGCTSEHAPPAEEAPAVVDTKGKVEGSTPAALAGTSWVLESLGEGDARIMALPEVQPTLGFLMDRYGGDGGCNFYVGVYNSDGANLIMETPAHTGAACADTPEAAAQESVYMTSLATVASFGEADGKLELYSSSDQLMLTMTSMEVAPLAGTLWTLQFVTVETQWEETLAGSAITMQIDGNVMSGWAGCNEYTATVSEEAAALTISDLSFTEMGCMEPAGVMEQETLYLSLLEQAALIRQFPVSLQLLDIDGASLLMYGASE